MSWVISKEREASLETSIAYLKGRIKNMPEDQDPKPFEEDLADCERDLKKLKEKRKEKI